MHNIYYLGLSGERSLPFGLLVVYLLAYPSRMFIGELKIYQWMGVRLSVDIHNAQTSPKSLGQSKPNFVWSLYG